MRPLLSLLGLIVFAYVIERYPALRDFRILETDAQFHDWSGPDFVPAKYSRFVPFSRPQSIALQSRPRDPERFIAALRSLREVHIIMHFSEDLGIDVYKALGSMKGVSVLNLHYLPSDAAFQCFAQFESTETLIVFESHVTDASLPHVEKFQNLTMLELGLTGVSPKATDSVAKLSKLKDFRYSHDWTGDFGPPFEFDARPMESLQRARPSLVIHWD